MHRVHYYNRFLGLFALERKIASFGGEKIVEIVLLICTPIESDRLIASKASNCFEDDIQVHLLLVNSRG